ncbi:hypothetical conserved protein [Rhizobium etli CIAT 652]|uniref:Hypothetical conserved protein n=1 Tax=Rhizobium etli (strain CIAT 652) TaxID=491916 RepID=B3PY52_RHIE6|nr:hypothetical conserved protein [Rhizobium etli CIAT 652]KKZ86706.1 hypothetical protein RPHASCH2410_CH16385 [Rhizobium phaseoli Ch24-10]
MKSVIVVLAPHQPSPMAEKLGNEDQQHAGAEAVDGRPARQAVPQVFGVFARNQKVGDDDKNERQIEQTAPLMRIFFGTKEIDHALDHLTTPSAKVRK